MSHTKPVIAFAIKRTRFTFLVHEIQNCFPALKGIFFRVRPKHPIGLCPRTYLSITAGDGSCSLDEEPTLNRREIDDKCLLKVHGSPRTPNISFISNICTLQLLQIYYLILRATNLHGLKSQLGCLPLVCDSRAVREGSIEMYLVGGWTDLGLKLIWSQPTKEIGFICKQL